MSTRTVPTLDDFERRAVSAIRRAAEADRDERTPALREIARVLVDARQLFTTADGEPDWRGRTHDYRDWAAHVYARAGLDRGSAESLSSSVRYHVSAVLRQRLDEQDREALGLSPLSSREAAAARRGERAQANALVHGARPLSPEETEDAVKLAERLLRRAALGTRSDAEKERLLKVVRWLDDAAIDLPE